MRASVILNPRAKALSELGNDGQARVCDGLRAQGFEPILHVLDEANAARVLDEGVFSSSDVVIVGGGDGTVRSVAQRMLFDARPMCVLPLGTLNHFAKDLGVPKSLGDAIDGLGAGTVKRIDVGDVNGQVFVNNASLGLYPKIVALREREQSKRKVGKWPAMARATWMAMRRIPSLHLSVSTAEGTVICRTPFLFIGNNRYAVSLPDLGQRERLDEGVLSVYVGHALRRRDLLRSAARTVLARNDDIEGFDTYVVNQLRVTVSKKHPRVALDGEVMRLVSPLTFHTHKGALKVLVPEKKPE